MRKFLAVVFSAALLATPALADPFTVPNTGDDGTLPNGAADSNYDIVGGTAGVVDPTPLVVDNAGFPFPPWIANGGDSKWIGPDASQGGGTAPVGTYIYEVSFVIPGTLDHTTASISGEWTTDNFGVDILINGASTGQSISGPPAPHTSFHAFSVTSGFVAGTNTLRFIVDNISGPGANPSGLRVRATGDADPFVNPIPEPASMVMLGLGLAGAAGYGLRRRRTATA